MGTQSVPLLIEQAEAVSQAIKTGLNGNSAHADIGGDAAEPEQRPIIDISDQDLERGTKAAWAAIKRANDPPTLFVYGGLPTRIDEDETTGAPIPRELDVDRLRNRLGRVATYVRTTPKGEVVAAKPPVGNVRDMLADSRFPLPVVRAITEVPTFAPDGSLPQAAGYHAASQTYYAPAAGFAVPPIPDHPTPDDTAAARAFIVEDLFGDFPFTGESELAHAVALLLQPFSRNLILGPTPLYLFEKPSPGTGATLLVDMISLVATARSAPAMTEGRDEDEMRKRLTAALRGSPPIIFFDNLRRTLDYSCLAAAITETYWRDRILGTSETVRLPIQNAWVATGNNPALSSEMTRRTIRARMDAKVAQPWLRTGFRHANLRAWVISHRGDLVAACLTLVRAWIRNGKPEPSHGRSIGMFEEWATVMGGIVEVAGIPGFLGNCAEFYERSDTEGADIRAFLLAWWEEHAATPVKVSTLFTIATSSDSTLDVTAKTEQGQRVRLGQILSGLDGRHYQLSDRLTVHVARSDKKEKGAVLWQLIPGESSDSPPQDSLGQKAHNHAKSGTGDASDGESGESFSHAPRANFSGEEGEKTFPGSLETDSPDSLAADSRICVEPGCDAVLSPDWGSFYCATHGTFEAASDLEYDPWD
jgi:putative DNA primase/helicase